MKEVSAQEAHDLLQNDSDYRYLDVRSVPEFEAGHPKGAINIPIMHFDPATGMSPNEDFVSVVEANLPKDSKLVIGCKSGARSARACDILSQLGYVDVANVRGGFSGAMNNFGQLVEPGWSTLDLPTSTESDEETSYASLAAKTGK